ncbi:hypothetical protein ISE1_4011 [plant metagenome]|uniref:Uncharacterized protein n=1 Tax=plant metagenome TaxID=1297885 RepID=A0A484T6B7_9ZZZZ
MYRGSHVYLQSGVQRGRLARHCGVAGRFFFCFVAARLAAHALARHLHDARGVPDFPRRFASGETR